MFVFSFLLGDESSYRLLNNNIIYSFVLYDFISAFLCGFCAGKEFPEDDEIQRLMLYAGAEHVLHKVSNSGFLSAEQMDNESQTFSVTFDDYFFSECTIICLLVVVACEPWFSPV